MADYNPNQFHQEPYKLPKLTVASWGDHEEWTALYIDGYLDQVGDSYLIDERIAEIAKVEYIEADFLQGGDNRETVAQTLDELKAYNEKTGVARQRAQELRNRAQALLEQADLLER